MDFHGQERLKMGDSGQKSRAFHRVLFRQRLLAVFNAFGRVFPQNGSAFPTLGEPALLEKAIRLTGLEDFGDESFREPLGILLQALHTDARLNLVGRIVAHNDVLRLLCNRLRLWEDRKRHPGITDQIISRPLFITGLPRSGSTLLHALLAQGPAFEAWSPSPGCTSVMIRDFNKPEPRFFKFSGPCLPRDDPFSEYLNRPSAVVDMMRRRLYAG